MVVNDMKETQAQDMRRTGVIYKCWKSIMKSGIPKIPWNIDVQPPWLNDGLWLWFMVFNATFNNISVISWRSVLLLAEIGVHRENHRPAASHW